jgi:hypothetical protein
MDKVQFLVGTSGWTYPDWLGFFYPDDWPKSRWFEYYAKKFATVESMRHFIEPLKIRLIISGASGRRESSVIC